MHIDPGFITAIQSDFLQKLSGAFAAVSGYAVDLLYIFVAFELVMLGIMWALQQDAGWGRLFFKIIKIGLIFVIIQNYSDLLEAIINSFSTIAGVIVSKSQLDSLVLNPAQLWQYGYNVGLHLLQSATNSNGLGLTLVLTLLGMGILLVFGLLGIQLVVQLVGFYLVALVSLIMLPFGAFEPSRKMFDRAVQAVLQAGVRVMAVIIVIGIAAMVWDNFDFKEMATVTVSLNQTLGLFFTALLFLFLAIYLPRFAVTAVGGITSFAGTAAPHVVVEGGGYGGGGAGAFAATAPAGGGDMANMRAAAAVEGGGAGGGSWQNISAATPAAVEVATAGRGGGGGSGPGSPLSGKSDLLTDTLAAARGGFDQGSASAGINFSTKTLKKLKDALAKIE